MGTSVNSLMAIPPPPTSASTGYEGVRNKLKEVRIRVRHLRIRVGFGVSVGLEMISKELWTRDRLSDSERNKYFTSLELDEWQSWKWR